MHSKSGIKSVVSLYIVFVLLLGIIILVAGGYFAYIITVTRADGQASRSDWPKQYTAKFAQYVSINDGIPHVSGDAQSFLDDSNLWVQFLGEDGAELSKYNKPATIPSEYSVSAIAHLVSRAKLDEYTVFMGSMTLDGQNYNYLIGFPINIAKTTMYFNGDRFSAGKPIVLVTLGSVCLLILISGIVYGIWLTKHLSKIVNSASNIAARTYMPVETGGVFEDAYQSLNKLDAEIRASDDVREESNRLREEWIANITHDLKTPLSPIKGHAELMSGETGTISPNDVEKYSHIILKNAIYAEELINDLKLTYQLESGVFPVRMERTDIARLIKEIIIDLLNNPAHTNRKISCYSRKNEILMTIDSSLIRRAVTNIITNAIIHNTPETEIAVTTSDIGGVTITVSDNGKGMTEKEQKNLFSRYYRGINMEDKPEGSGLGLAIVRSIAELYGGTVMVESSAGKGTSVSMALPVETKN